MPQAVPGVPQAGFTAIPPPLSGATSLIHRKLPASAASPPPALTSGIFGASHAILPTMLMFRFVTPASISIAFGFLWQDVDAAQLAFAPIVAVIASSAAWWSAAGVPATAAMQPGLSPTGGVAEPPAIPPAAPPPAPAPVVPPPPTPAVVFVPSPSSPQPASASSNITK